MMQKQILFTLTIFITSTYTMEKHIPHIVYNINTSTNTNPLATKLSQNFTPMSECLKEKEILSHQSPQVTCVHSHKYLDNLDKHPSIMLAAINKRAFMSLYPDIYSRTYFAPMLHNISTTLAATECVIAAKNIAQFEPNYAISMGEGYSVAGHAQGNNGDVYAAIPIAADYALSTQEINRILIIDEILNKGTSAVEQYYNHGNGSIFYPKNNPDLSALFDGKVVTRDRLKSNSLWAFLNSTDNDIDFTFYNINIEEPDITDERESHIYPLLKKLIPTVFILSGDKEKYQENALSIINYIVESAQTISSYLHPQTITPQQSPRKIPHNSSSRSQSDIDSFEKSSDDGYKDSSSNEKHSEDTYKISSSSSDDVFKITTDPDKIFNTNDLNDLDIHIAKSISFKDGVMEVKLTSAYDQALLSEIQRIIEKKNNQQCKPNYRIKREHEFLFTEDKQSNNRDACTVAATYALKTNNFDQVLIINENFNENHKDYCKNNPNFEDFLQKKIITAKNIFDSLTEIKEDSHNLALYNINVKNFNITEEFKRNIELTLKNCTATLFILTGLTRTDDKCKGYDNAIAINDYITKTAKAISEQNKTSSKKSENHNWFQLIYDKMNTNTSQKYFVEQRSYNNHSIEAKLPSSLDGIIDIIIYKDTNDQYICNIHWSDFKCTALAKEVSIKDNFLKFEILPMPEDSSSDSEDETSSSDDENNKWREFF